MVCPKLCDGNCKIDSNPCPRSYLHKMGILDCTGPVRKRAKARKKSSKKKSKKVKRKSSRKKRR